MTTQFVFRKEGIPALAWPSSSSSATSWPCTLVVKVNETYRQAAIVLRFELPIHGFDTDQHISLVYHADNWVSGEMKRGQEVITPWHINQLSRAHRGGDKMDSLTVMLKQPCTILCPSLVGSNIAPRNDSNYPFQEIVALAKGTKISIVFDGSWLRPHKSALLSILLEDSNLVNRFPRDHLQQTEVELDWTVFSPRETAPHEAPPPAYGDVSLKRSERSPTSSTRAPPPKRPQLDLGSPTEKATTITATPSPRPPLASPVAGPLNIQDAVDKAVAAQLPAALNAVLPDIVARIFAVPTSPMPSTAIPATSNPMSPFHKLLINHLTAYANELTRQVTVETLDHASDLRETADMEFQEQLEEQKSEFVVLREDTLMDMQIHCDTKLQEFKEHVAGLIEDEKSEIEEAYTMASEKLDNFVTERRLKLKRELWRIKFGLFRPSPGRGGPGRGGPVHRRVRSVPTEIGW